MLTEVVINSVEAEMVILGCMINSENDFLVAHENLDTDDFVDERHRKIFSAIRKAKKSKGVVDIVLVGEVLKNDGDLQEVGDYAYLTTLSQFAGSSAHIEAYCDDLRQLTTKRKLINVHASLANDIQKGTDAHTILERLGIKIEDLKANKPKADSLFRNLLDATSEKEIIQEVKNTSPGVLVGCKLGDTELKLPGGAISIVAGPTGHGKTTVLTNFILNYLDTYKDKQAFFFSYEESRSAILSLFLNTYINEELSKNNRESIKSYFRNGDVQYISEKSRTVFLKKKDEFFKNLIETRRLNIFYSDYSAEELVLAIRFLKKDANVGLIGIDYMQLLSLFHKKNIQRQEELKQICLMLKDCAVDTGLPILLAAQFNRTVVNEAGLSPTVIGEAGDIERAANMVIGLWNRNYDGFSAEGNKTKSGKTIPKEPAMYLEIMKSRETGTGHSSVFDFNGNTGKLTEKHSSNQKREVVHVAQGNF